MHLARCAAVEYAHAGIRCNTVNPGRTDTPMLDRVERELAGRLEEARAVRRPLLMDRLGTPQEIAEAVVWLCSDAASYVTGQCLHVDGGITAL